MKYYKEKLKKCTKCSIPMDNFGKSWICPKCGWHINKKVVIGNRLV